MSTFTFTQQAEQAEDAFFMVERQYATAQAINFLAEDPRPRIVLNDGMGGCHSLASDEAKYAKLVGPVVADVALTGETRTAREMALSHHKLYPTGLWASTGTQDWIWAGGLWKAFKVTYRLS